MPSPLSVVAQLRRRLLIHRRGLAALCLGLAVWLSLTTVRADHPDSVLLWTATHDLPAGTVLAADDFRRTAFAPRSVPRAPARNLRALVGHTLAVPLGAGEVMTRRQVLSSGLLAGYPGRSAIAVRIPDVDTVGLLRPGDHVDLVASDPQQHLPGRRVVRDAVVLLVPRSTGSVSLTTGRPVVLAVPSDAVEPVADAAASLLLTVIWTR
jgi:pilus assembly protein CpaB